MKPRRPAKSMIKEYASGFGIDGIRVTDTEALEDVRERFRSAMDVGFIPSESAPSARTLIRLTTPTSHLKGARSIVSAYESYYTREAAPEDATSGAIARYTRRNYYADLKAKLEKLADFMRKEFTCRTKAFSCYVALAEKPIAEKAGLGFYGKNSVIVTTKHGSFVLIGEIITDLRIEPDGPVDEGCGHCSRCMDACPTGAIKRPYFVDRNLCIQYLSERKGTIPVAVREAWRNRLYGCTDCQDVCPYNRDLTPIRHDVKYGIVGSAIPLMDIIDIRQTEFSARFADNQIGMRDRNAIRRNAIIAAGNSRSEMFITPLVTTTSDPDPMIRQHSLWALFKIMGRKARPFLGKALNAEQDGSLRTEIKSLLDGALPLE
jgi:epoxyqueuosine reductase